MGIVLWVLVCFRYLCSGHWYASGTCVLGIGVLQVFMLWALCCGHWCAAGTLAVGIVLWALVCFRCSIGTLQVFVVGVGALQVVSWYAEVFIVLWPLVCFRYTYGKPVKGFLNLLVCPSGYGTFGQACATRQVEVSTCLYLCFGCGCVCGVCVCICVGGVCIYVVCVCAHFVVCVFLCVLVIVSVHACMCVHAAVCMSYNCGLVSAD